MNETISASLPSLPIRPFRCGTVVGLIENRICRSIHISEYERYCEAVYQFELAEVGIAQEDSVLNTIL